MSVRSTLGLNALAVLLFTSAVSVLFAGLHVVFQSNVPLCACMQWTLAVVVLAVLNGLSHDRLPFFTTLTEGLLTFILVVIASSIAYAILPGLITGKELGYSILSQFVLIAWTSYDTTLIFPELYVDEAHLGAIYFPIHLFICLGYLVMMAVSVLSSAATVSGGGGGGCGGDCADCIGGRCSSVCCCCVWCYDECERNPPYRPKRTEIQPTARIRPLTDGPVSADTRP